ncbi:hypothetical protein DGM98_21820 [Xanthomonas citri]|uniref:Uncharacterized protein n=1 Tax=Xanthomonas citri pv. phaseoli var. fuscans TaxID=473423 RepID=A0AB33F911_XANCI|nr:hypothetical protein DGM98_21820 [Xanthomonas citri]
MSARADGLMFPGIKTKTRCRHSACAGHACEHHHARAATRAGALRASRTLPWPGRENSGGVTKTQNAGTGPAFCDYINHQPVDQ